MQRFYIHVILFQWKMTVCQGLAIDGYKLIIFWWYYLITFGTTWNYWEPLGTIWIHWEPFESIRQLGTICNRWNYLEPFCPFGTIWSVLNHWNHPQLLWTIRYHSQVFWTYIFWTITIDFEPFETIWNHWQPFDIRISLTDSRRKW